MFSYATPSALLSDRSSSRLGLACDETRPLHFEGRLQQHIPLFRFALRALGELIWSHDSDGLRQLDPIVTVHPDLMIFEGFSSDLACYGRLCLDLSLFEVSSSPQWGTTNVDFGSWLWSALGELRSSRQTWVRLGQQGLEVETRGWGGRFQPKVAVPNEWYRAFLELQGALQMSSTRVRVDPVDLLIPVRFLRHSRARVSPRAMRYVCQDGGWKLVLEPWEQEFPLGAEGGEDRTIRCWGRQRLRRIEPLLPFASEVEIRLCGRALPHFYRLTLPKMSFLLGLTGWGRQTFGSEAGYSLWGGLPQRFQESEVEQRLQHLGRHWVDAPQPVDGELIRRGLAMSEGGKTRYRPLTSQPLDLQALYPPDPRQERALGLSVEVTTCEVQEQRKVRRLPGPHGPVSREVIYRDWRVTGRSQGHNLELVVSDRERILFGRCGCDFFQRHLLQQGPCEHLLALFEASREQRPALPTSHPVQGADMHEAE